MFWAFAWKVDHFTFIMKPPAVLAGAIFGVINGTPTLLGTHDNALFL